MLIPSSIWVPGGSLKHMFSTFYVNPLITITLDEQLTSSVVITSKAVTLRCHSTGREMITSGYGKGSVSAAPYRK